MSWFNTSAPAQLRTYWQENYPAMRSVAENLAAAIELGWTVVGHFPLPLTDWTRNYYAPLQRRLPDFLQQRPDDPDARAIAEMTEQEIAIRARYPDDYGYQFYILRPADV